VKGKTTLKRMEKTVAVVRPKRHCAVSKASGLHASLQGGR
jgi:hypothetical protein